MENTMNERIKELAKQAGYRDIFDNDTKARARLEKYTELIVRECCQFENSYSGDARLVSRHYGRRIREHFGVEE
jgi:hypothetical protein